MSDMLSLFHAQAARRPEAAAVEDGRGTTSYRALAARAAGLARRLRALDLGAEDLVALALEKSALHAAALLGVWRAGAAFLPLDPSWPRERTERVLRDAGARLVLTDARAPAWLSRAGIRALRADRIPHAPAGRPAAVPPGRLAYVIYSSGSTGEPKGVEVEHRGLAPMLRAQIRALRLRAGERALFGLSTAFDASLSDIGTALISGATLVIPAPEELAPRLLARTLARLRVRCADLPPALLAAVDPRALPACLRTVVIGGEACAPALVRRWARRVRVVNAYGPTETTVCASLAVCGARSWDRPYLGRPLPGTRFLVRDGELWIGGSGVGRGYRNRPELTRARFPSWRGRRWFRSGDRVRERPGGHLEFLGRVDRQLKLRGRLVAPEEIEARLSELPGVARAAVLPVPNGSGSALAAFIEPRDGERLDPARLRRALARSLPDWLIPRRWEILARLPVTHAGKIDLGALARRPARRRHGQAPRTGRERILARLFRRVLGVKTVGRRADFFALGGDSLSALALAAAAESRGITLTPERIAAQPTVAALARASGGDAAMSPAELEADVAFSRAWRRRLDAAARRPAGTQPDPAGRRERRTAARRPGRAPAAADPKVVFFTGATGFLGSRLLRELLVRTRARFLCLVRAPDEAAARTRLHASLRAAGVPKRELRRVAALRGDAERPRLGLARPRWDALAREVDTVFHCAARLSLALPYRALRAAHVGATGEVLRLLCAGRRKRLHYASTLAVLVWCERGARGRRESDALDGGGPVYGGYAQSKWAAERLLRAAGARAGPVSIYRFGLLAQAGPAGPAPSVDWLSLFLRGTAAAGRAPARRALLDITPVDYAAAAAAYLALDQAPETGVRTFHIANQRPATLDGLIGALRALGVRVSRVRRARRTAEPLSPEAAAARLAAAAPGRGNDPLDLFPLGRARLELAETLDALADSGLRCPAPGPRLLARVARAALGIRR